MPDTFDIDARGRIIRIPENKNQPPALAEVFSVYYLMTPTEIADIKARPVTDPVRIAYFARAPLNDVDATSSSDAAQLAISMRWMTDVDAVEQAKRLMFEGRQDPPVNVNDPGLQQVLDLKANKVNPVLSGATLAQSPPVDAAGNEVTTAAFVRSAVSQAIALANSPVNTALPAVSVSGGGAIVVGSVLNGTSGSWNGQATITYTYQWFRNGVAIGGETSIDHTVVSADQGTLLTLRVRASNGIASNVEAFSAGTNIPAAAVLTLVTQPTMSGTPAVGQTLTVGNGAYNLTPTSYSRQWYRGTTLIPGATGTTYVVVAADQGFRLTAKVTAVLGTQSLTTDSAPADIPAAAPAPTPPPPPPPAGIAEAHIQSLLSPNLPFAQAKGVWGLESDGTTASINGMSDTVGFNRSDLGGTYGTKRFGKITDPADGAKKCFLFRVGRNDGLTASAPRCEVSIYHTYSNGSPYPGRIETNLLQWAFWRVRRTMAAATEEIGLQQLHQLGGNPANPFHAVVLRNGNIRADIRWNANPSSGATNGTLSSANSPLALDTWSTIVCRFKHTQNPANAPTFQLWQDGVSKLVRNDIIGYNNASYPPWFKCGLYPYGWNDPVGTGNHWPTNVPFKEFLYGAMGTIVDTGAIYSESQVRALAESI